MCDEVREAMKEKETFFKVWQREKNDIIKEERKNYKSKSEGMG